MPDMMKKGDKPRRAGRIGLFALRRALTTLRELRLGGL
jgi:hypothetical protein